MARYAPHPDRRVAVITGASSGIGTATARAFAAAGHPVVLGARRVDRLEALAGEIRDGGGEAVAVELDLGDPASVDRFADRAGEALGPIDVVVSNAGDVVPFTALAAPPDDFAASVHVNLLGAHRLVARLGPALVAQGHGDIVFVTSDVVIRPRTHMSAYVTAKAGLEGLARAMQMELEGTGVRVGIVRPGPASTEQGSTWSEAALLEILPVWTAWGLMRHDGYLHPRNVADAILAMVSFPKGTHITLLEIEPEAPVAAPATTERSGS